MSKESLSKVTACCWLLLAVQSVAEYEEAKGAILCFISLLAQLCGRPGQARGPPLRFASGESLHLLYIAVISTWESVFVVCNIGPDIHQSWGEIVARKWFIRVSIRTATSAQSVATFLLTGLLAHSRNMTESTTRFMKHWTIIRSPSAIRKIHIDKVTKVFQFHSHRGHCSPH